jgi:uncharacterized protein YabE (DUF348 family)
VRRSVKYGLYGAVLAGVLGGTLAWINVDKTVTLEVDGTSVRVHTVAGDVSQVLAGAGYRIGAHDLVAPGADAQVHDGSLIVLKRGRLLHLQIDGVERDIWVTDPTVSQAMADLGFPTADFTSVSRDQRLPLTPTDIDIRAPKQVTLVMAGKAQTLTTTDATVGEVLDDMGVALSAQNRITPAVGTAIAAGEKITVQRVTSGRISARTAIPFTVLQQPDATMSKGQVQVVTSGQPGTASVIYGVVYVDGVATGKTVLSSTVLTPPTTQIEKVGTAPVPPPVVIQVDPGSAQAIAQNMMLARGWGSDQFSCLVQMWDHESGWRVNAQNGSGAYGIPQALPGDKMAAFGADWQTNPATQIAWGLAYISGRYGTPCAAWSSWQANGWY